MKVSDGWSFDIYGNFVFIHRKESSTRTFIALHTHCTINSLS